MERLILDIRPAPSTPLNLALGTIYAPRVAVPAFAGFSAHEIAPDQFAIYAYDTRGRGCEVFRGALFDTFVRFAEHLGMVGA